MNATGDWDDDESELLPCPSCNQMVFEDTEKCPYCGDWIMPLRGAAARPAWARWVGVLLVLALLSGAIGGLVRLLR